MPQDNNVQDVDLDEWDHFVPFTLHTRPNNYLTEFDFPVVDSDTVLRARDCIHNDFSYHCEDIGKNAHGNTQWSFTIADDVAEYDVRTRVFEDKGDKSENRRNISDWIKSFTPEQLLSDREQYIAQENAHE